MSDADAVEVPPAEPVSEGDGDTEASPVSVEGPPRGSADRHSPTTGRHGPGLVLLVALGVLLLVAAGFAVTAKRQHDQQNQLIRVSGLPSSISTPLATLMFLAPIPARPAPNFTLVDQNGRTLSLSSFRGHAVVLEFMDTHCTDICPIVSQEFIDAYHDLGPEAEHAVFVAVNVNAYHAEVSDVSSFSREHQLDSIPNWHFFTGSVTDLQSVWNSYHVVVQAPNPNADIIHSSFIFFIDPKGNERYLANPTADHAASGVSFLPAGSLTSWGQGIALVSRSLG